MSIVVTYLNKPVVATIIRPVGTFQPNEQVNINRVTAKGTMFGVAVANASPTADPLLFPKCVDPQSRATILGEYELINNAKRRL